jgi:hypothetical protein
MKNNWAPTVDLVSEMDDDAVLDKQPSSTLELGSELCILGCTDKFFCLCDREEENYMVSALTTG